MKTFCIHCRKPIPSERAARRAVTCSGRCQKEYRRQARQDRAEKKCRLCGRRFRTRRPVGNVLATDRVLQPPQPEESLLGAVLMEHNAIMQGSNEDE